MRAVEQPYRRVARAVETASPAVVVLNWNNAEDTLACLTSLRRSTVPVTLIAVDNGSQDASADEIEASGLADHFVRTGANLGYAGGNNVGLRWALEAGYDTVMVLNNDTVAHRAMVECLLQTLPVDGTPMVLSPRIVYYDSPDEPWFAGGVVDRGWPRHLQADEITPCASGLRDSDILTGCCLFASATTWKAVGLFDERYFLIFEDSDWSMRARRAGVQMVVCDDAVLEHRVSRSFRAGATNLLGSYYFARNGLRFHRAWQRGHTAHFLAHRVARPMARSIRTGEGRSAALFTFLGALAGLLGPGGPAASGIQRLAALATNERSR